MTYQPVSLESLLTHQGWALRVARRLVHEETEAEDLVQRTWMAALRRPPQSESGARAWIRKVILNLARERHRRNQARVRHEQASGERESEAPDTLECLSRTEMHRMLGERLMKLSEPYRTVVLQRFYEDLSSVEIAERMGIPAGTVRWRLKVGLDQLRAEFDRRSEGDRHRWVSALLAFLTPSTAVPNADTAPEETRVAPATSASWLQATSCLALGAAGLLGLYLWQQDVRAQPSAVVGLVADAPVLTKVGVFDDTPPRARDERTPLDSLAASGPSSMQAGPRGVSIRVEDGSGAPVAGARILVARASGFELRTRSDSEGRAWLAVDPEDVGALGLAATRNRVAVRALASGRVASDLIHVAPPFAAEHEVRLVVGGPDSELGGRVIDPDGRAVPGATVAWFFPLSTLECEPEGDFSSPSYLSVTSDAEGRFALAHLARGKGSLVCFARGFATFNQQYSELAADSALELRLARGALVSGAVRWPDGRPAAGVRLRCEPCFKANEWATGLPDYDASWRGFGESTRSDGNGRFRLEGINADGRERMLWALDEASGLTDSITLRLEDGAEEHWEAELAENAGLRLKLVDEAQRPLAGWVAHIRRPILDNSWWVRRAEADAEGRVRVSDCPTADLLVDVFPPFGLGASRTWRRLQPSPEEQLVEVDTRAKNVVTGQVLGNLGAPELRGELAFHSIQTTLATRVERDASGAFEQALAPGQYVLVLQLDHTAAGLVQLTLRPGESKALGTLVTPAMGTLRLSGAAFHDGSERAPAYSIFKLSDDEREGGSLLVGDGALEGEVLFSAFPGRYRVFAHQGSGAKMSVHDVRVLAHAETRLALQP